ncbi:MAG TPA: hypothetical protein VD973_25450 [Symbiobacteriaceae bacterium]|jgi:hypothetical protein|nr:hypothetical protein [Symbiobacteriaceae bacterium]
MQQEHDADTNQEQELAAAQEPAGGQGPVHEPAPEPGQDGGTAPGRRPWRLWPPRGPWRWALLGILGVLLVLLLFLDFHLSFDSSNKESSQAMGSAKGIARPIGDSLRVYLYDESANLPPELLAALVSAVRENELPFADVMFVSDLPSEAHTSPVLAIRILEDRGFWTPLFASRQMKVRFYYAQGWSVNQEAILEPGGITRSVDVRAETCEGACARGERDLTLGARSVGLLSLPHMRSYVAGELAREAVVLVKDGLPENLNPEKWDERARELAQEQEQEPVRGGTWSTFQRIPGCRGGVLTTGQAGPTGSTNWSLIYYDAARDALSEKLTQAEVAAQVASRLGVKELELFAAPGFGLSDNGLSIYLGITGGGSVNAVIPPGMCGLSGIEIERR